MSEEQKTRGWLRPRYSLTTLFVVVTVCCASAWLGAQVKWIRQRHEMLEERYVSSAQRGTNPPPCAPSLFWLFREPGYEVILYPLNLPPAKASRIRHLFPEADVQACQVLYEWDDDGRWSEITWDD